MNRILSVFLAATVVLTAPVALGQSRIVGPTYKAPEGVEMEIVLYPITSFRGNPRRFRASDERINVPVSTESIYVVRGIWELCSQEFYYGRCITILGSQQAVSPPFPVRSLRLIGDTGPTFLESPQAKAGSDAPFALADRPETQQADADRAPALPVVAPTMAEGGVAGNNPSLAGRAVEFFAAPATDGKRVLACSQSNSLTPAARCVQASADGFCASEGFRDSGWREYEVLGGRAYLVNVLCKQADDNAGGRDANGIRIPFF